MSVSFAELQKAVEALDSARSALTTKGSWIHRDRIEEAFGVKLDTEVEWLYYQQGLFDGKVESYITPFNAKGEPCGAPVNTIFDCPPWCGKPPPNGG